MISFKSEYSLCDHIGGLCPDKDINRIFEQHGCRIDQKSSQKAKDITNMVEDRTNFLQSNPEMNGWRLLLYTKEPNVRASTRLM